MGIVESNFILFESVDVGIYQKYLELKYGVFYSEFSWSALNVDNIKHIALPDKADPLSRFIGCYKDSELIGVARISLSDRVIPYYELYKPYLESGLIGNAFGVLNAVAVKRIYRGKKIVKLNLGEMLTIGEALISCAESVSVEHGCNSIVLTATCKGSEKFFRRIGYTRLGECYEMPWAPIKIVDLTKKISDNKIHPTSYVDG